MHGHPAGEENLHLAPQTGGQDRGLGPKAGAGIPAIQAVAPLPKDRHLDINDPTHQNTSAGSIHAPQTPGEDVNCIRFSIQAKFKIQFNMRWR